MEIKAFVRGVRGRKESAVKPLMGKLSLMALAAAALPLAGCGVESSDPIGTSQEKLIVPDGGNVVPGEYIVVFHDDQNAAGNRAARIDNLARSVMSANGLQARQIKRSFSSALPGFVATISHAQAEALAQDPSVKYIEQNQYVSINETWGLDRTDQRLLPLDNASFAGSGNYAGNGSGVHAYIIDTGIRGSHSEFTGRVGNGYDFVDNDSDPADCNGHGTHVAGTVAGTTWGLAKGATVHGVRVLGCGGSGTYEGVIAGIDWVTANHQFPAVANMSLVGGYSQAVNEAVTASVEAGVVYAVAAGNSSGADACNVSPASTPDVLTVGSTTNTDARSSFSNIGPCLDLFAPGTGITSAWHTSNTATNTISGTSMATPHVAGAAALYRANHPGADAYAVSQAIVNWATMGVVLDAGTGSPNKLLYVGDRVPVYSNSFESASDFSNWLVWHNCAADTAWSVARYNTAGDNPAPGGGSWSLRMHTTGFTAAGCAYPGAYALSPPIQASAGKTYYVYNWSRNAGNAGVTSIIFYNSSGQSIGMGTVGWSGDAWQYNADPVLSAVAPVGTSALRIRFGLSTPSEYADLDLLRVFRSP